MHMTRVNFPWLQDTMWRDIAINWQSGNICDIYLGIGKCASSAHVCMDETHLGKTKNQLYTWRLVIWLPISPAVTSDTEAWAKLRLFLYAKCVPERIKIQHDSNYRLSLYRKNDVSTKHFATASFTSPLKFMRRFICRIFRRQMYCRTCTGINLKYDQREIICVWIWSSCIFLISNYSYTRITPWE